MTMRTRRRPATGARLLDVLTYLVVFLFLCPIFWLISTAFKTRTDAFAIPPHWFFKPTLANFKTVLRSADFVREYANSVIVAGVTTVLVLIIGVPAAYALTRFAFKARRGISLWILSTRLLPTIGTLFPLYIIFNRLHMLDTYQGLIFLYLSFTLVFVIWMMRGYFMQVPVELEEASLCDGASRLTTLVRIVMPIAAPGMAAVAVFTFIISWNEFLFALIFTRTTARTAPVAITAFMSFEGINWGPLAAAGLLVLAPVFIFSVFVLKYLVAGLAMGAVKD